MRSRLKTFSLLGLALLLLAGTGAAYFYLSFPRVGATPPVTLPNDPARLQNGRYLAEHVAMCVECHSTRDWSRYAGPIEGARGAGGEKFVGEFGVLYSPNITPTGIGEYSDDEFYRAVASGLSPKQGSLFPLMPYPHYGKMDKQDLEDILAYIRTLPAGESEIPPSQLAPPLNLLVRTMPATPDHQSRPERSDTVAYGRYLVGVASCAECHTPKSRGQAIEGMDLAGGFEFQTPWGTIRSSNITPHKTGIAGWSKERFIERFKGPRQPHNRGLQVAPGEFNTVMPWVSYSGMTEEDLGAIFDYLQTVQPVDNPVRIFEKQ